MMTQFKTTIKYVDFIKKKMKMSLICIKWVSDIFFSVSCIFVPFQCTKMPFLSFGIMMRGLKSKNFMTRKHHAWHLTVDQLQPKLCNIWPNSHVPVVWSQTTRFPINIWVLNWVAVLTLTCSIQEWNFEAKNEIKLPFNRNTCAVLTVIEQVCYS